FSPITKVFPIQDLASFCERAEIPAKRYSFTTQVPLMARGISRPQSSGTMAKMSMKASAFMLPNKPAEARRAPVNEASPVKSCVGILPQSVTAVCNEMRGSNDVVVLCEHLMAEHALSLASQNHSHTTQFKLPSSSRKSDQFHRNCQTSGNQKGLKFARAEGWN